MPTTRTEQAIDEIDLDDVEFSCDDIRLAWLAGELDGVEVIECEAVDAY